MIGASITSRTTSSAIIRRLTLCCWFCRESVALLNYPRLEVGGFGARRLKPTGAASSFGVNASPILKFDWNSLQPLHRRLALTPGLDWPIGSGYY